MHTQSIQPCWSLSVHLHLSRLRHQTHYEQHHQIFELLRHPSRLHKTDTASDMILQVHSDTSYLSESKARSCAGGLFYMGSGDIGNDTLNRTVLASTSIMKPILSSASEAEISLLFDNCKKATIQHTTLAEMGWLQPATPIQTDNSTACGIANNNIKLLQSHAMDMRFYWVHDHRTGTFSYLWKPGTTNFADYFTKHHAAWHHQLMQPVYLHENKAIAAIANTLSIL
jgi:hypothetical protein